MSEQGTRIARCMLSRQGAEKPIVEVWQNLYAANLQRREGCLHAPSEHPWGKGEAEWEHTELPVATPIGKL